VRADIFCLSDRTGWLLVDGEQGPCGCSWCWFGRSDTSGKTVQLKNVHHVPSIKKNLISGFLLCRDGYKLIFESNKCVVLKYGTFVEKGYESGGLFRLSLVGTCFKSANHVVSNVETNIWHSRLCHVNFGCMSHLAGLNLILKFDVIKSLKCHVC
jgi:hypothetical protein